MTLDELIAALERADGPSLDLDHAIATAAQVDDGFGVPLYTASLDAALALREGPYALSVEYTGMGDWECRARCGTGANFSLNHHGEHPTSLPIALCIAAMKARKS